MSVHLYQRTMRIKTDEIVSVKDEEEEVSPCNDRKCIHPKTVREEQ